MIFLYLASLIILGLLISRHIKRPNKTFQKNLALFLEKESVSNSIRKKSLYDLPYIIVPLDQLFLSLLSDNETAQGLQKTLISLAETKIVNLTGISNTDLKLEYGTANITVLIEFDQNYTLLARSLHAYGALLFDEGYLVEACKVLEFSISTTTDISATYHLLTTIYLQENTPEKILFLQIQADKILGLSKSSIVRALQEAYQYND